MFGNPRAFSFTYMKAKLIYNPRDTLAHVQKEACKRMLTSTLFATASKQLPTCLIIGRWWINYGIFTLWDAAVRKNEIN